MRTIWKHPLGVVDVQFLKAPAGAEILCVREQNGKPAVWFLCDPHQQQKELRKIAFYGTGHPIDGNPGKYISTFQLHAGRLVFHAFELEQTACTAADRGN